ncbi:MAG: FecR domain-containing protein [Tannerellaceae bacterium]|jgi:ferric-dicitrate binding protein FerR (iron transport regulator)|nr:FecR domain-containing protein [Tannerellaceae bacterium]
MEEKERNIVDADLLITKIVSGNATPDDILAFSRWLNETEGNKQYFLFLREYFDVDIQADHLQSELAFEKFEKSLNVKNNQLPALKRYMNFRTFQIAASIVILVLSAAFFYRAQNDKPAVKYYTYLSGKPGSQIVLDDGTLVHLNKDSRLSYSNEFGKDERTVELEGEAYFDVSESNTPFKVNIGQAQINVSGTKFNVKAYPDDHLIIATLEEGVISFSQGRQEVILKVNEQLIFDKSKLSLNISTVETSLFTSWKDGVYKYASIPFGELTKVLEKIYNVEIKVGPPYADVVISGSFEYDMTINQILDMIKKSLSYSYKMKNNLITIY